MISIAPAALADAPNLDSHAGKLIARDGSSSSAAATSPKVSLDLDSGRVALALVAVTGLILMFRYVGKTMFPAAAIGARAGAVKVLARTPLAPRQHVILLQIGRRIVVAADCGSQLSSLCQITDADEVASLLGEIQRQQTSPISHPFTAWFKRARDDFGDADAASEAEAAEAEPASDDIDLPDSDADESAARQEIRGLADKVRALTRQLGGPNRAA